MDRIMSPLITLLTKISRQTMSTYGIWPLSYFPPTAAWGQGIRHMVPENETEQNKTNWIKKLTIHLFVTEKGHHYLWHVLEKSVGWIFSYVAFIWKTTWKIHPPSFFHAIVICILKTKNRKTIIFKNSHSYFEIYSKQENFTKKVNNLFLVNNVMIKAVDHNWTMVWFRSFCKILKAIAELKKKRKLLNNYFIT